MIALKSFGLVVGLILCSLGGLVLFEISSETATFYFTFGCTNITEHVKELWINDSKIAKTFTDDWTDGSGKSYSRITHRQVNFTIRNPCSYFPLQLVSYSFVLILFTDLLGQECYFFRSPGSRETMFGYVSPSEWLDPSEKRRYHLSAVSPYSNRGSLFRETPAVLLLAEFLYF